MNKTQKLNDLYFKDDYHKELFNEFLERVNQDYWYITFCYIASAIYKRSLKNYISCDGIKIDELLEAIKPFSATEQVMIQLALHLFNSYNASPEIDDVFSNLDRKNKKVVMNALMFRYS